MVKKKKEENNNYLSLFDTLSKEVTYHNDFSNTIFKDFSLKEKQLLLFLIAGIDSENKVYNYNPKEIKTMLNMSKKEYVRLSNLVTSIQKKPLVIYNNKKIISISIFDSVTFEPTDTSISVRWGYSARELFKNLKGNFSKYFAKNIGNLKFENSVEFYLKAESNLFKGSYYISLEDIKTIFDNNYSTKELKRSLINKSVNDINNNTDITLEVTDIKEGRKIVGFSFNVSRKNLLNEDLFEAIRKIKKNNYVNKSGLFNSSEVEKTIHTLLRTFSEEEIKKGLILCYSSIKEEFKSIVYLEKAIEYALTNESTKKKTKPKNISLKNSQDNISEVFNADDNLKKNSDFSDDEFFNNFINLDSEKKEEIEKKAIKLYSEKNNIGEPFVKDMKKKSPTMFYNSLKNIILELITATTTTKTNTKKAKLAEREEVKNTPKKRGRRKKLDMIDELDKAKEVEKNEKTIKSFMKKKYGKEKMLEMINSSQNYEELMFEEYINFLKEKEKNK